MSDPTKEFFMVTQMSRADIAKELTMELDDLEPNAATLSRTIVFANNAQLTDDFCTRYARAIGEVPGNIDDDAQLEKAGEVRRNFLNELGLLPRQVKNLTEAVVVVTVHLRLKAHGKLVFSREQAASIAGQGVEIAIRNGIQESINVHRTPFGVTIEGVKSEIDEDAEIGLDDDQTN